MNRIEVTLISGRTARQGVGLEEGKLSERYIQSVNAVSLNPEDASSIGLVKGGLVKVSTEHGCVTVYWTGDSGLDRGMVFFPYGPWANQLYASSTDGTGMPQFKGIKATVSAADGGKVPTIQEIVDSMRGGKAL
ncbi:MAG: molybdopterin dinucleotide binding domain-containing protein [Candidatus Bathyarchaeota archaeon]